MRPWLKTNLSDILEQIYGLYPDQTYLRVYNKSNTMGATCGAGTAYDSGLPESIPMF
jgi:hypothetical protein